MPRGKPIADLRDQVAARLKPKAKLARGDTGSDSHVVTTGSTLLDLAISGGRFARGGIPAGIMVEIFGPSGCGKTVLLCEIAGGVQRSGGAVMFRDPEARLNQQFAKLFGFSVKDADYAQPDTVSDLFEPIRQWQPKTTNGAVNGIFADSLAALSTDLELADGDKYGMRRAKEFSEECRKVCRVLTQRNLLMVCSNQVRSNLDNSPWAEKFTTPGGLSIGFYSSLRLRCHNPRKINRERNVGQGKVRRVIGVETQVEVYKSTVWQPYHVAPVSIIYDYGVDNVRSNLEFVKATLGASTYRVGDDNLGTSLDRAIAKIEVDQREEELINETIELWHDVERKFKVDRIGKRRL